MSLRLGDAAPNFKANTTIGEIDFYEYLGDSWGVLFSIPLIILPFVQRSWAEQLYCMKNLLNEM